MAYSLGDKVQLIKEIQDALEDIDYGSVEVYVQNKKITQITVRNIKKTDLQIPDSREENEEENQFPIQNRITQTYFGRKD